MFLQKLEIELPYDLALPPLGRNPSQHRVKRLFASCLFLFKMPWDGAGAHQQVGGQRKQACAASVGFSMEEWNQVICRKIDGAEIIIHAKQSTAVCRDTACFLS